MLLNLSNHPSAKWSPEQINVAHERFGDIVDLPFPEVDPQASLEDVRLLAAMYGRNCAELFATHTVKQRGENAVHLMGELVFTYLLVRQLDKQGILCVASTTERSVSFAADGSKVSVFRFVQFRGYNTPHGATNTGKQTES